jgi:hypothetical protein
MKFLIYNFQQFFFLFVLLLFISALDFNDYSRIWVADIHEGSGGSSMPVISNIKLAPNYVVVNGGSFANFTADISGGSNPVLRAGFSGFNSGFFEHIIGNSNSYWFWDDETHGDLVAGDGNYGAESVGTSIQESPNPNHPYMIRFSARIEHQVTVVDVEPFFIRNSALGVAEQDHPPSPSVHELMQNFPNPFNLFTSVSYYLAKADFVNIVVFDHNGRLVAVLVNEKKDAGYHLVQFDGSKFTHGVYFYTLRTPGFSHTKKLIIMH